MERGDEKAGSCSPCTSSSISTLSLSILTPPLIPLPHSPGFRSSLLRFPIYSLSSGEQRGYLEFPHHMIDEHGGIVIEGIISWDMTDILMYKTNK